MKILKRLLLVFLILFVLIIAAAIAIPYIYKDEIVSKTREEINKTLRAKVDFEDVDISLLRTFPDLSAKVTHFSVTGIDDFEGIPLASAKSMLLRLNLMSVINGNRPVEVEDVTLENGNVNVLVLKDGKANYDITIPTDERITETAQDTSYSAFNLALKKYNIKDANIRYEDRSQDLLLDIKGLNHKGSGNFTMTVYDLDTHTEIDAITTSYGDITYLKQAHTVLDAIFNIDTENSKYTLKDNALKINDLLLNADGFVQMKEEDILMDIAFNTPQNEFKDLLSMIPNAYIEGYEDVKADGKFSLEGNVKGTYNGAKEEMPGFKVDLTVDNAKVQYPDLPLGITNIFANVKVNSPGSDLDDMVINAPRIGLKIGDNPFDAKFNLKTPISDPDLNMLASGVIDLEQLAKAYPIEGMESLAGIISADVSIGARMSQIEKENYDEVSMRGDLEAAGIKYHAAGMPKIQIARANCNFSPDKVTIKEFDALLGKSDLQASGSVDNILAYFSPKKTMTGDIKVRSSYFDSNEWMPAEETSTPSPAPTETAEEANSGEIFDRFDFKMDGKFGEIVYDVYKLEDVQVLGSFNPSRLQAKSASATMGESDFSFSGDITNIFDYLFENGTLGGNIKFKSEYLNLNEFMPEAEDTPSEAAPTNTAEMAPILIPENIKMDIDATIDEVLYTDMTLKDIDGKIRIEDQAVILDETTARGLGGQLNISGSYDTEDVEHPRFSFKYDLSKLDFQKAFNSFNTFQALAPIGKFIKGNFNSTMIMEGELGQDMMPLLSSLTADGFLETINGAIAGFAPLEAVGNNLNVDKLKNFSIKNTKNWFEIKDGGVEVKEFDYKVDDIDMKIGGRHSLTQEMDYRIKAKIPRKLLEKGAAGAVAGQGFDFLQGEASKLGLNLKKSEFVNVMIQLTGSVTKPKTKIKLLGSEGDETLADAAEGAAKEELDKQKEALTDKADEKLEEGKEIAKEQADKVIDSAKTVVGKEADKLKDKAGEILKTEAGKQLDSTATKKLDQILGDSSKAKIEDKLKKFNPFKKKKKKKEGEE